MQHRLVTVDEEKTDKKTVLRSFGVTKIMKRQYSASLPRYLSITDYTDGDYVRHRKFGDGYVRMTFTPEKVHVVFAEQPVFLTCRPGFSH